MKEFTINTFDEFHKLLDHKSVSYIYRGQADASWELLPKAGRQPFNCTTDQSTLKFFKRHAVPFLKQIPSDDWEWLTIAQHYGVPTRLLDWSKNPLVAAFFAVYENMDRDAAVYRFKSETHADIEKCNPFDLKSVTVFKPVANSDRILKQRGLFTIHPQPDIPFSKAPAKGTIEKYIISKKYRRKLRVELNHYGFNYFDVFYDLQSLAEAINWKLLNMEDFA